MTTAAALSSPLTLDVHRVSIDTKAYTYVPNCAEGRMGEKKIDIGEVITSQKHNEGRKEKVKQVFFSMTIWKAELECFLEIWHKFKNK